MNIKEVLKVSEMTVKELITYCCENGLEDAREYDKWYLEEYAMTIAMRK